MSDISLIIFKLGWSIPVYGEIDLSYDNNIFHYQVNKLSNFSAFQFIATDLWWKKHKKKKLMKKINLYLGDLILRTSWLMCGFFNAAHSHLKCVGFVISYIRVDNLYWYQVIFNEFYSVRKIQFKCSHEYMLSH